MEEAFGTTRKTLRSGLILAAVVGLGATVTFAGVQAQCPTSQLAPFGLAPQPQLCSTPTCLVNFGLDPKTNKPYQWWTSYEYDPNHGYFYNGGLQTIFAPGHAFIGGDGKLHLKANNDVNLGGPLPIPWSGAEAVLMFNGDGSEANLGYGDYLVTAKLLTAPSWDALDPNMALGLFLYERPNNGVYPNTWREIDLAEISRWGKDGACPNSGKNPPCQFDTSILCNGNAQFALQQICNANAVQAEGMVDRYDIGTNDVVTLVMKWHAGKEQVTMEKYSGAYTFQDLPPGPPTHAWEMHPNKSTAPPNFKTTSPSELNSFIPDHGCERFHINFWFGNYARATDGKNPPPNGLQEVVIENFQFRPFP